MQGQGLSSGARLQQEPLSLVVGENPEILGAGKQPVTQRLVQVSRRRVARISARANEGDRHALLVKPDLGVADKSAADTLALRGRFDTDDANLADPTNRIYDSRSHKSDVLAIDVRYPLRCRVRIEDLARLFGVVVPPVLTVEKPGQFLTEHLVDRGENWLPGAGRERQQLRVIFRFRQSDRQLHSERVAERRATWLARTPEHQCNGKV
jgi:hypothetical protein